MNIITGSEHLEESVDQLAHVLGELRHGHDELICSLEFEEAEALAEVLEAGLHPDVAAHLMHRWALTEPDWDAEHGDVIRAWLASERDLA